MWRRIARQGLILLFLAALLLFGAGAAYERRVEEQEAARFDPPGELYDIGGRTLHLYCLGQPTSGQPAVILEAGEGDSFYTWWNLQAQLAQTGLVCSYDRSGYGWSEAALRPRTSQILAAELQALLRAAGLHPPFLLVGHSFGGLIVQQYALDYPDDVHSLVLVESLNPEAVTRLPELLRKPLMLVPVIESGAGAVLQSAGVLRILARYGSLEVTPVLTSLPDQVLPAAQSVYFQPRTLATAASEQAGVVESVLGLVERDLARELPVIVLLAAEAGREQPSGASQYFSSLTVNTQVRQLPETSHYLHLVAPSEVLGAIWELQRQ